MFAALIYVLAGQRGKFETAILHANVWLLALATALQVASLLTRTEAWHVCMRAAGGTAPRRLVYRAGGVGALGNVLSAQLGLAARIGVLRRSAPDRCPRVGVLIGAEVPIFAIEMLLAALFSFTLVAPLHLPLWTPLAFLAGMLAALAGLRRLARVRRFAPAAGLTALRDLGGRGHLGLLVLVGIVAQVLRTWLLLRAVGVDVSISAAIATLIVSVSLSLLPLGAGVGATATVLILGAHGVSATAAAGVLLTVTGTVGAICFALWAGADHAVAILRPRLVAPPPLASPAAA